MNRKKILILSAAFHPRISPRAFRATELAIELARQGHEVEVSIPDAGYDYSAFMQEHSVTIIPFGRVRFKPIELKGRGVVMIIRRVLRRVMGLILEFPDIELMFRVSSFLKRREGYDLLISIAVPYPIHWGVARARKKNRPIAQVWAADCGDPYMGVTADSFRKMFYFKYVEKWFSRKADFITIPWEGARSEYYKEFHHKIRIIPQGFRMENLELPEYTKTGRVPTFAYAGGFSPVKKDPGRMLSYLSKLDRDFRFVIYTSQEAMLRPFRKELKEKLEVHEYIPREELLKILAGMDFLVNISYSNLTQLPSKLIDYAITGRPVLNVTANGDLSILEQFLDGNYSGRMELDPAEHDIRVVASKFTGLLNEA